MVRLSALQLNSVPNVDANIESIRMLLAKLPVAEHHLVVLPECCLFFGGQDNQQLLLAKKTYQTQALRAELSLLASDFNVTLVAGTVPVLKDLHENKFRNRCFVFSPKGEVLGHYDKIHLFDTVFKNKSLGQNTATTNHSNYNESNDTLAGTKTTVIGTPFAPIGLSVCYDLRFPELYRQLCSHGAEIITVPSAFTRVTGAAHWQTLLQARAIENQVYIVAAGQEGVHQNHRETWGHSMIISPWGEILNCQDTETGFVSVEFKREELMRIRASMPIAEHNQFDVKLKINH